jgi:hypothetical protein
VAAVSSNQKQDEVSDGMNVQQHNNARHFPRGPGRRLGALDTPMRRSTSYCIHTSPTVQALQSSTVLKIIKLHYDLIMTPTYTSRVGYLCTSLSLSK